MLDGMPAKAVLDSNILFSRVLHELFGRLASTGDLLELIWSNELVNETIKALIEEKGLDRESAELWVGLMTDAFPTGRVNIGALPSIDLGALTSDKDDHHICALAIAGRAQYIFTFDKGFDPDALLDLGIEVTEPDAFLSQAIDTEPELFREILTEQAATWGDRTLAELIDAIERTRCPKFAGDARKLLADRLRE